MPRRFLPLVCVTILPLTGCGDDVQHVPSPDGEAAVIVRQINGGASTSVLEKIYLQTRTGADRVAVGSCEGAILADGSYGVGIRWQSNDRVEMECWEGRSIATNQRQVTVGGRKISVGLGPTFETAHDR